MQIDDSGETSEQVAACVSGLAQNAFASHEVMSLGPGEWLCKRPGTGMYHFYVISRSGALIVYGDLGEWILRMENDDPVVWAREAVRSPGYFFEKVRSAGDGGRDAFYKADVHAWLLQRWGEPSKAEEAIAALADRENDEGYLSQGMAIEVLQEDFELDDIGWIGIAPSARSYWLLEAMRWFTAHVVEPGSPEIKSSVGDHAGGAA